ncbi:MAG: 2-C-methyl-D-erythritol 2,4-cyclodiphosphate synthase [Thermoanaerobaculia bacterium]
MIDVRVGQGVDVHPFDDERPLILGGVRISERGGLAGHSDADAVLHALVDAILGALGAGDIGQYFPSEDERWRNADSKIFVREAMALVEGRAAILRNVDVTVIAQKPKLAPHRDAIRDSVAAMLGLERERVNVKATTTDHLGFIGRAEGICAMAVVSLAVSPL